MIWFKRALPFVLILAGWLIYTYGSDYLAAEHRADRERFAQAVADCWLLEAEFAGDSTGYLTARDSVLATHSVTSAQLDTFLAQYKDHEEYLYHFLERVTDIVDSVAKLKLDSIDLEAADSARNAQER